MTTFSYTTGNPSNLTGGGTANMTDIQGPFTDLRTFLNGANLDDTNIAPGGGGKTGAFLAYGSIGQTLASTNVVGFNAEMFDVSGWHDSTVNVGRYTPLVAGYYHLSWCVNVSTALVADKGIQTYLRKNGTVFATGSAMNYRTATFGTVSVGTVVVQANGATDYFDVRIDHDNGGNITATGGTAPLATYFSGELIGRT